MATPPKSVSPQAAAFLSQGYSRHDYPAPGDTDGWRRFIRDYDAEALPVLAAGAAQVDAEVIQETFDGAVVYRATPAAAVHPDRAVIYLHMGGLSLLGGEVVRHLSVLFAAQLRHRIYAIDFRRPPDHPFPAGLDDCVASYRALVARHGAGGLAILGDSGGANLAAALCLRARDEGLPASASLVLRWPQIDLTESGDSFVTNREHDVVLQGGTRELNALYLAGHDAADPYASPLFGDFSRGFPPTLLLTGTRDSFLSNAVRMHRALRAAAVEASLEVFEAMPHGGFGHGTPEDRDARQETSRFILDHWR